MLEVAEASGLYACGCPPIIVGHSFGASPLIYAASKAPDRLRGGILIDCHFRVERRSLPDRQPRPHGLYPSLEAALARFRFTPPQTCSNFYIADFIARGSAHEVDGSWTWRFDPALRWKLSGEPTAPYLASARAPLIMMAGDRSEIATPSVREAALKIAPRGTPPWLQIPDAGHHVMVDQPLPFIESLQNILARWPDCNS